MSDKSKRSAKQAAPTTAPIESTAADRLGAVMLTAIEEIEGQIAIVATRRQQLAAGGFDKDLSNTAASLARALASLSAEHRAGEKAREYTAKNLPREVLFESLRRMSSEERAHVRREIDSIEDTESVLG